MIKKEKFILLNMKKQITLIIFSFFLAAHINSQTLRWKAAIGGNIGFHHISDVDRNKAKTGFDIGVAIETPFKENKFVEAGLYYSLNRGFIERELILDPPSSLPEPPTVIEDYSLYLFKVPVTLVIKQKKTDPLFFGIGTGLRYNLHSHRNGYMVQETNFKYSHNLTIDTKSGSKFGLGVNCVIGKELKINKHFISIKIKYDTDLSKWRYPTNFEVEKHTYISMRSHNISLLTSFIF